VKGERLASVKSLVITRAGRTKSQTSRAIDEPLDFMCFDGRVRIELGTAFLAIDRIVDADEIC
tara:strand:+ start:1030 stop:1218 length:189 start_codon:yes stop_codon:yes gene_type:complete